jgi:DNA-binding FrmR family transcriptional regulator
MTTPPDEERSDEMAEPFAAKAALLARLRRLAGQTDGVVKMVEADRPALEVLQQLAAVRAATREAAVDVAIEASRAQLAGSIPADEADNVLATVRTLLERSSKLG